MLFISCQSNGARGAANDARGRSRDFVCQSDTGQIDNPDISRREDDVRA
jgi:hypothetical protein